MFVVVRDIIVDGAGQFGDAAEHADSQSPDRDIAEEALGHIQPRGRGWREMHVKARMLDKPGLNHRMLMGRVVIADQVVRARNYR